MSKLLASPTDALDIMDNIMSSEKKTGMEMFRNQCEKDYWFFMRYASRIGREFICKEEGCQYHGLSIFDHPYIFKFARIIQAEPDSHVDLHPRFHLKSTNITFGYPLWELLREPNTSYAIATYKTDETGEAFISTIANELRHNELLKDHWPDRFYKDPDKESPNWKKNSLTINRTTSKREPTFLAFGLNALPTMMHFDTIIYDDIVVEATTRTPGAMENTTDGWRKCTGLQGQSSVQRITGTRWAIGDTYEAILEAEAGGKKLFDLRHYDCYVDPDAKISALHPGSSWLDKWEAQLGSYNFSCQMRNNPVEDSRRVFDIHWVKNYDSPPEVEAKRGKNIYYFVDPASNKKKKLWKNSPHGDYNAIIGVGLGEDGKYYVVDIHRDRMKLTELIDLMFDIDKYWRAEVGNPVLQWWYEEFAAMRDVDLIEDIQEDRKYRFKIKSFGSKTPKESRIERLQPYFMRGDIYLPKELWRASNQTHLDMVNVFLEEEFRYWAPGSANLRHDDMLDCLSFMLDPVVTSELRWPSGRIPTANYKSRTFNPYGIRKKSRRTAWGG